MNYRHLYHAGNFADVLKHGALALCLAHLRAKPAAFRVIDTHAGAGRYDLASIEAGRTLEWIDGIGRLLGVDAAPLPSAAAAALAPYLDIVRTMNDGERLSVYPGSPAIARAMLRPGDRLVANELHAGVRALLAADFEGDAQAKVMGMDGWTALKALTPPPERRGLVFIDPPFERRDDFENLARGLGEIAKRFATGVTALWYPVKDPGAVAAFLAAIEPLGLAKTLRAELYVRAPGEGRGLAGAGMFIVNPPWTLAAAMEPLLAFLAERLAQGPGAGYRLDARGD